MSKRRIHHVLGVEPNEIIAENSAHEGKPRTQSAARAQESWEEFKEKSNHAAEAVIDELTHPTVMRTRIKKAARRTVGFYRTYQTYLWIAAGLAAVSVIYAVAKPMVDRRRSKVELEFAD